MTLIVTSGGLGPTADDLTAEIVGRFCGREMVLDEALEERIAEILRPLMRAGRTSTRRRCATREPQAGGRSRRGRPCSTRSAPRPGSSCRRRRHGRPGPTVVVLPGPPRELQPMWETRGAAPRRSGPRSPGRPSYRRRDAAAVRDPRVRDRRDAAARPSRRARRSTAWRSRPACAAARSRSSPATSRRPRATTTRLLEFIARRVTADTLFSDDGRRSTSRWPSCCAGRDGRHGRVVHRRAAGRAADRARRAPRRTSLGGGVVYSNEAKTLLAGVAGRADRARRRGLGRGRARRSPTGIAARLGADVGVGITGIAGPGGGTPDKPVGLVCISVWAPRRAAAHPRAADARRPRRRPRSLGDRRDAPAAAAAAGRADADEDALRADERAV